MPINEGSIRIGTRGSELALWQADHVADLLRAAYPDMTVERVIISTKGDEVIDKPLPEIGGKGLFTAELERALLEGDIDCAVHSLKDLPTDDAAGLIVGAMPERAPVEDVLVSRKHIKLDDLPQGAVIGTSSLRRAAQLLAYRDDLVIRDIRGNVPTRIKKVQDPDGPYDATVLAHAGVTRLGLTEHVSEVFTPQVMLPAPGQGAIGIQIRDEDASRELFAAIDHQVTRLTTLAERAFLNRLEGGCSVPVASHAQLRMGDHMDLFGRVVSVDGKQVVLSHRVQMVRDDESAHALGVLVAEDVLREGADEILAEVRA